MNDAQRQTYVWSVTGSDLVGTGDARLLAADLERIHRRGEAGVARIYRLLPGSGDLEQVQLQHSEPPDTTGSLTRYAYQITTRTGSVIEQFDVIVHDTNTGESQQ